MWFVGSALCLFLAGCTGGGEVTVVPWMRSDLSDSEPLVQRIPINHAYYWTEVDGRLNVALHLDHNSLLGGAFNADWMMCFALEGLPAGSSRLYKLRPSSADMALAAGADRRRGRTWAGVVVLDTAGAGRLRGRFHVNHRQQQFTLLHGWWPPPYQAPIFVATGRFTAVENAVKGRAIRDLIEEAYGQRPADAPATRPAPTSMSAFGPSEIKPDRGGEDNRRD